MSSGQNPILIKEDQVGDIMLPEFSTYCKTIVNMKVWNW